MSAARTDETRDDTVKQQYFIVVLAHSLHGRLRRIHVPQQYVYVVLALAVLGCFSVFGFVSSYVRMVWKVANYNSLRQEVASLRTRYQELQDSAEQTNEQLATLQLFAKEVSVAYGIKQKLEGPTDIAEEGRLVPTFHESLEDYRFLRSANFTPSHRKYARMWHTDVIPSLWPVEGRLLSRFGDRIDPFSGEGAFHAGVDIGAPSGTPVRASADGVVTNADRVSGYGRLVAIDHGGGIRTYYAHLSSFQVMPGQEVRRGQAVGTVGSSGRATGVHLHYEVRRQGHPINPYTYLAKSRTARVAQKDLPF